MQHSPSCRECGVRVSRSARRQEQHDLAADLRRLRLPRAEIAAALRDRYGVSARLAMRTASDWSQADVAAAWTERWPDDPKTFKSVSYWENWPSPTGHAPSLTVIDRLAQLYECDAADLLAGWGEHGPTRMSMGPEPETLAWQTEHLDLPELTRSVGPPARGGPAGAAAQVEHHHRAGGEQFRIRRTPSSCDQYRSALAHRTMGEQLHISQHQPCRRVRRTP